MNAVAGTLRERIAHWTREGYRVVSETTSSAQLVRPKRFNATEFIAMPLYLLEYAGQREQQIYLALDDAGQVTETGSGLHVSRYRRAQGLSGPMRLFVVIAGFVAFVLVVLALQALT